MLPPAHLLLLASALLAGASPLAAGPQRPKNIVIIYADDLGYGDVGCYGATQVATPQVDRLAREGRRFTSAHSTSATCTPSRYALLSGEYPWRHANTGIRRGDAALVIDLQRATLPALLQRAGYATAVVGKWHLGLGAKDGAIDWNQPVAPGPREVGFDYSFIMAATADRVPCVYLENQQVVGLDPQDPLRVSYEQPFPGEPTGVSARAELKLDWSHGHNMGLVNGIGRIGHYAGGRAAQWVDEDMADTFTRAAVDFITREKDRPFFLYFATHDIHVPRVPHARFVGQTTMGARGDAIVQFDWQVGEILAALERHGLTRDTLVILSSDNGPVIDDGYQDGAVARLGEHRPAAQFRGGKYSRYEAGTRVPFIVRWPAAVAPGQSDALFSQVDLLATCAALTGQTLAERDAPDSLDLSATLLGATPHGRDYLIEHAGGLALREGSWKYIAPAPDDRPVIPEVNIETANRPEPQLYDLSVDIGEKHNLAATEPARAQAMADKLAALQRTPRTR